MKLLIGLGNPGAKHARNRHNAGFAAIDAIAGAHGFAPWRKKFQGHICDGRLGGEKCLLLKPATYMNESGRAASQAVRFYKLALGDVIVLHDEIDLAPGKVRVKTGGGVAGHNGLRSLTRHIGNDYVRVRIGVGHPGHKGQVHGHVLKNFSKSDRAWLDPLIAGIADAAPLLAQGDTANFMNRVSLARAGGSNAKPASPKRKRAARPKLKSRSTPRSKSPSQRDLARIAARHTTERDTAPAGGHTPRRDEAPAEGPFARLRKLFGMKTR